MQTPRIRGWRIIDYLSSYSKVNIYTKFVFFSVLIAYRSFTNPASNKRLIVQKK